MVSAFASSSHKKTAISELHILKCQSSSQPGPEIYPSNEIFIDTMSLRKGLCAGFCNV